MAIKIRKREQYTANNKQTTLTFNSCVCDVCQSKYGIVIRKIGNKPEEILKNTLENNKCVVCSITKYDISDLNADKNELERIMKNTAENKSNSTLRFSSENYFNSNTWNHLGGIYAPGVNRYGNEQYLLQRIVIQCKHCGYIKILKDKDLTADDIKNTVCNKCKYLLVLRQNDIYDKAYNYYTDYCDRLQGEENILTQRNEDAEKLSQRKAQVTEEHSNIDLDTRERDSKISRIRTKLESTNPKLHLLDMITRNNRKISLLKCDSCGSLLEEYTQSLPELRKCTCAGCIAKKENPMYRGIFQRKLVGTVINLMRCIEEKSDGTLILECTVCQETTHNRKITKERFLAGKIYCSSQKCTKSPGYVDVTCNVCYKTLAVKLKDINEAESAMNIVCDECGTPIYKDAIIERDISNKAAEVKGVLSTLAMEIDGPAKLDGILGKSANPLYVDSNNIKYYNCRCTEHHQTVILSEVEMLQDPHKFCNARTDLFISEQNIDNLRLNNEKSLNEMIEAKKNKKNNS